MTWSTIRRGPLLQLEVLRGVLKQAGIQSLIPDRTLKVLDPFATGALSLDCQLQVPADLAPQAQELIQRSQAVAVGIPAEPEDEVDEETRQLRHLEELGRRVCWAATLIVTHPFALYYGAKYLARLSRSPRRPRGAMSAVGALLFVILLWGGILFFVMSWGLLGVTLP